MAKNNKASLKKEQELIESYYSKIEELKTRQKERENQFAMKVGKLVLSKLNNDIDEIDEFSDWLQVYLEEQNDFQNQSVDTKDELESDGI
jgi:hypothetical protein